MKRLICFLPIALISTLMMAGCGGGSSGGAAPPPPPPDESPAGVWAGQAVTPDVADVGTSFEFADADGFVVGEPPFTADFQGGSAETQGNPALYQDGLFSWHVSSAAVGTITFEVPTSSLSFFTRTVTTGDVATISIRDTNDAEIDSVIVPNNFTEFTFNRDPEAGNTLIGSVTVNVVSGEIVIDVLAFGFPSSAATDDVSCVVSTDDEFACIVADATTGDFVAGAQGTVQVSVDQVTGGGTLYAAPGETFADGSTIAQLTISAGTVAETSTLDLTIDGTGVPISVMANYDTSFERGSALATVEGVYPTFDIFGDGSSFEIDATGVIFGQSAQGCALNGQVSIIDAAVNAYDVAISVADSGGGNCAIPDGDYEGLGVTQDENATDDLFLFGVFVDGIAMLLGDPIK